MNRIQHYQDNYETITEFEHPRKKPVPFVKIVDVGERVIVNHVKGHIESRIVYFLMNLNITPRCIYFSRVSSLRRFCFWLVRVCLRVVFFHDITL